MQGASHCDSATDPSARALNVSQQGGNALAGSCQMLGNLFLDCYGSAAMLQRMESVPRPPLAGTAVLRLAAPTPHEDWARILTVQANCRTKPAVQE
jgi:hypothetical protein